MLCWVPAQNIETLYFHDTITDWLCKYNFTWSDAGPGLQIPSQIENLTFCSGIRPGVHNRGPINVLSAIQVSNRVPDFIS